MSNNLDKIEKLGIPANLERKTVLELFFKNDLLSFECEKRGAKVIGVEPRRDYYNFAIKLRNQNSSFVNFLNMHVEDINHLNYRFDLILFVNEFNYVKDQFQLLKKIFEKLKRGGLLIIEFKLSNKKEGEFFIDNKEARNGDIFYFPNKFTIKKLLKDSGFQNVSLNEISSVNDHSNCLAHAEKEVSGRYQAFSEIDSGGSNSTQKLKILGLPENLHNQYVLDLGCNEGFFCFECEKRGAKEVVGIERNKKWFNLAIQRKNEFSSSVNFLNEDWSSITALDYKFDLILFLASFHYIKANQIEVLRNVYNKLKDGGLLILELGLSDRNEGKFFIDKIMRRTGDVQRYPNKFTIKKLLEDAGFQKISFYNDSKIIADVVPRYVIHAIK